MSQRDKNLIVTILAIIGGIVVLGWLLKLTFALLGPVIVIALGVVIYLALTKNKGGRF
ncbi:hypothetical protein PX554_04595 [Sphingomonas sp. H39-1-10]|uniref:hypothetical protein n=1 Tax=Sphingomonas pollutisoli TaxID=3030829 RepID=UPI0023B92F50|nr:hypothetical protein [Sphingomonas pollutisoli]MDF0487399.1 hypothetical protein [Sphingomonas pollutisoli]